MGRTILLKVTKDVVDMHDLGGTPLVEVRLVVSLNGANSNEVHVRHVQDRLIDVHPRDSVYEIKRGRLADELTGVHVQLECLAKEGHRLDDNRE